VCAGENAPADPGIPEQPVKVAKKKKKKAAKKK
jgi:hypothetical protein